MLSNAGVAFGLNVAAVFLISAAGGLVLTLAGVFKVSLFARSALKLIPGRISSLYRRACSSLAAPSRRCKSSVCGCKDISQYGLLTRLGYSLALGGLMAYKNASAPKK